MGDAYGYIVIFLNKGSDAKPVLKKGFKLKTGWFAYQCPGGRAKPEIVDYNGDGLQDIMIGTETGRIVVLLNEGKKTNPKYDDETDVFVGSVGPRLSPSMADFNGDGKQDLVVTNEFSIVYYLENQGSESEPQFSQAVVVEAGGKEIEEYFPGKDAGYRGRLDAADYNGDGKVDIILGTTSKDTRKANVVVIPGK